MRNDNLNFEPSIKSENFCFYLIYSFNTNQIRKKALLNKILDSILPLGSIKIENLDT